MDLHQKIRTLPTSPGVYLYKNADGQIIYVGKANNLRSRVRSYFLEGAAANAKTGSLLREAVDLDYVVVDNEKEALALENNLIKQKKPRYNILLRDDKTYPYIKLTIGERYPRVFPTRRLRKDGSLYFGPYFPTSLAYRLVDLIHRHFLIPSCKLDLNRYYPRPCLQYYIGRCLGPCVEGLTTPERYAEAVHDVKLFLEGRGADLTRSLQQRMTAAAEREQYELAAKYRDLISTVTLLEQKQRIAAVEGDDADVFGYHYENEMLAVNLFHMRGGKIVDKREFFWEDLHPNRSKTGPVGDPGPSERLEAGFHPGEFFSSLLKQIYLDQQYVPHTIYVPVDFEDRDYAGRNAVRGTEAQGADPCSAARGEALAGRSGWPKCEAGFRSALPGDEAGDQGDPGSAARRAHAARVTDDASSASTSRTSRARRRSRRWWSGKTAR